MGKIYVNQETGDYYWPKENNIDYSGSAIDVANLD